MIFTVLWNPSLVATGCKKSTENFFRGKGLEERERERERERGKNKLQDYFPFLRQE